MLPLVPAWRVTRMVAVRKVLRNGFANGQAEALILKPWRRGLLRADAVGPVEFGLAVIRATLEHEFHPADLADIFRGIPVDKY